MKKVSNDEYDYEKDYMKIKFNSDDDLALNKPLTYYQRNRDTILNRAKDYYKNDKERLRMQARNEYINLSEEES